MNKALKNIKVVLVLFFTFMCKASFAQKSVDSLSNHKITSIDIKSLVGFWQATDSLKTKIEFIDSSWYQLILDLKDNSHPYLFTKDTLNKISSSGYYPNWPPFDCDLHLIDPKTIEISFSQIGVRTYTMIYKKIR